MKLILIHHAGGSSLSYSSFYSKIPAGIELELIDLPGRNKFYADPWPLPWNQLIESLHSRINLKQEKGPVIFLGHSFGAIVALELAHRFSQDGIKVMLGVSGTNAPTPDQLKVRKNISRLPEIEFIEELKKLDHFPDKLPSQFIHLIKSDFSMIESYAAPLRREIPTLAFGGKDDPLTSLEKLNAWSLLVDLKHAPFLYEGNHFHFFQNNIQSIIKELLNYC